MEAKKKFLQDFKEFEPQPYNELEGYWSNFLDVLEWVESKPNGWTLKTNDIFIRPTVQYDGDEVGVIF